MIHIIDVQSRATMQDLGRFGLRRFGISHSGAMDKLALRAGNILLGNAEGAPAIEVPLGGKSGASAENGTCKNWYVWLFMCSGWLRLTPRA